MCEKTYKVNIRVKKSDLLLLKNYARRHGVSKNIAVKNILGIKQTTDPSRTLSQRLHQVTFSSITSKKIEFLKQKYRLTTENLLKEILKNPKEKPFYGEPQNLEKLFITTQKVGHELNHFAKKVNSFQLADLEYNLKEMRNQLLSLEQQITGKR